MYDKLTSQFLSCALNGFDQVVNLPTRGLNILDLVLCRNMFIIPEIKIITPLIISDHEFLQFSLTFPDVTLNKMRTLNTKQKFIFYRANIPALINYLNNINWFHAFSTAKNVDNYYTTFLKHFQYATNNFVPKLRTRASKKLLLLAYIRNFLCKKKKLWFVMKNTNSYNSNIKFKEISKICKQSLHDYHENKIINNKIS